MDQQLLDFAITSINLHLAEHPNAADTAEGIDQWWIHWDASAGAPAACPSGADVTLAALEFLAAAGKLEALRVGSRLVWRSPRCAIAS